MKGADEIGIGPNVRCAATVESPFDYYASGKRIECALSPADGHTVHKTQNEAVIWEGTGDHG